jgi:hypothetical protein
VTLIQVEPAPYVPDSELIDRLTQLYIMSKDTKGQMSMEWKRNYKITKNRAAPNVPSAPGTRANEVFPTLDSRIGWMTDQEILFTVTPACDPFSMEALVQDVLGGQLEAVMNSLLRTNGWYAELVKMLWDAAMYGPGFLKVVWDAGLAGGLGDVALKCVSPWCLYIDPFATNLEDANWIIEVHTMTASEIERRFPQVSEEVIHDAIRFGEQSTEHQPPNQFQGQQKRSGVGLLDPVGSGPVVPPTSWGGQGGAKRHRNSVGREGVSVYECWIKENYAEEVDGPGSYDTAIVDQWRVVVHAGGRVLLDEIAENLFGTDSHPYVRYVDVESGEFWGDPLVRDLAPCQQSLNTLLAMGQNNIVYTGNPMMATTKGSGADRSSVMNRPGQIFDVNPAPGGNAPDPRWIQPPTLPQAVMEFIMFWREEMERIAGLSDSQRGAVPSGRATDKQVQSSQEAGFIRVRSSQRNLELTLRKAGELVANLIILYYDTPRFVAIVGQEGENTSMKLHAQHFQAPAKGEDGKWRPTPMRFALTVNAGSAKPTSRAARVSEALTLQSRGIVDNLYVLQAFQVSHAQAVIDRQQKQQQQQMAMAAALGQGKQDNRSPRPKGQNPKPE